jgi:hypothetical protein
MDIGGPEILLIFDDEIYSRPMLEILQFLNRSRI